MIRHSFAAASAAVFPLSPAASSQAKYGIPAEATHMMNSRPSAVYEVSPEMIGTGVLIPADPLADARGWLAAMESSMRRMGQQAAQQSYVIKLGSAQEVAL